MPELWRTALARIADTFSALACAEPIRACIDENRFPPGSHHQRKPQPENRQFGGGAIWQSCTAPTVCPREPAIVDGTGAIAIPPFYHRSLTLKGDSVTLRKFTACASEAWQVVQELPLSNEYMPWRRDAYGMPVSADAIWMTLVFHLGYDSIEGSSLRANRMVTEIVLPGSPDSQKYEISFDRLRDIQQGKHSLPGSEYMDWVRQLDSPPNAVSSELTDAAAASVAAIDILLNSPATTSAELASSASGPILDVIDVNILRALAKQKVAGILIVQLAENAGYNRDTCSDHLKKKLYPIGYAILVSQRKGAAITSEGREFLATLDRKPN